MNEAVSAGAREHGYLAHQLWHLTGSSEAIVPLAWSSSKTPGLQPSSSSRPPCAFQDPGYFETSVSVLRVNIVGRCALPLW